MAHREAPPLSKLCALHFASIIGNGRVPPIDTPLPTQIGDEILGALCHLSKLNDRTWRCFTMTPLKITRFDSSGTSQPLALLALAKLQKYKELVSVNISSDDKESLISLNIMQFVTHCLSPEAAANLQNLNISGYNKLHSINGLGKLPSLLSLSIARRPISSRIINSATKFFPQLRSLDISETNITDLSWLKSLPELAILTMHDVDIKSDTAGKDLLFLKKLRVLDISKKVSDYSTDGDQESIIDLSAALMEALKESEHCPWPELSCLDIAGNALAGVGIDQAITMINTIITKCPKMKRISVVATSLDAHSFASDSKVTIMNCATRSEAMKALSFYWNTNRDVFTSHTLHAVYYCLQNTYEEFTQEEITHCAELVCDSMKRHLNNIGVQMAGSACLYHLCKQKRIRRLSPSTVENCMNRCLDAAENWKQMVQLQKNVWLTICNDYLLQLSGVNFYRTCKVALESMLSSKDSSVARMTIAIVSIVTPKMRPYEARELTGDDRYVKFLVSMLNENLKSTPGPRHDNNLFTLKFTLSALWNLTDESTNSCEVFNKAGGVTTCFKILKTFSDHINIQTKVLGILNNIAEVEELRHLLTQDDEYVNLLCDCLHGDFVEVCEQGRHRAVERSYFAAGVLSNLLAHPFIFNNDGIKVFIDGHLKKAVEQYPKLKCAMVSYKSFSPFIRILQGTSFYDGARIWCLWGIQHVLQSNEKTNGGINYFDLIRESSLEAICIKMKEDFCESDKIRKMAKMILDVIHGLKLARFS